MIKSLILNSVNLHVLLKFLCLISIAPKFEFKIIKGKVFFFFMFMDRKKRQLEIRTYFCVTFFLYEYYSEIK